jgi:alpha-tubulin suppressor-like RCC1 family protein
MALRVKQISAGGYHSLALLENGTVRGWGSNTSEALMGPGFFLGQSVTPDFGGKRVIQINAGRFHSLALLEDGTVKAWGNSYGSTIPDFGGRKLHKLVLVELIH